MVFKKIEDTAEQLRADGKVLGLDGNGQAFDEINKESYARLKAIVIKKIYT